MSSNTVRPASKIIYHRFLWHHSSFLKIMVAHELLWKNIGYLNRGQNLWKPKYFCPGGGGGGGGGGWDSHLKKLLMIIFSLRGINLGVWSHLGRFSSILWYGSLTPPPPPGISVCIFLFHHCWSAVLKFILALHVHTLTIINSHQKKGMQMICNKSIIADNLYFINQWLTNVGK